MVRHLLAVLVLIASVSVAGAVAVQPGVEIHPSGTLCHFVMNTNYEDNKSLVVEEPWFVLGGIKCYCDSGVELTVLINEWNPNNKDKANETVFDLSTIAHQKGSFIIALEGLLPNTEYTIYKNGEEWKTVTSDDSGKIKFSDTVGSENRYVIVKAAGAAPVLPPPAEEEKPFPWYWVLIAVAGVVLVIYVLTRR